LGNDERDESENDNVENAENIENHQLDEIINDITANFVDISEILKI
jgi:hypothetical protein